MADHLANIATKEGITADHEALHTIAQKADGALRDALSIFDQIVTFTGNNLTYMSVIENLNILDYDYYFRLVDSTQKEDIPSCLLLLNDIVENGFDLHNFIVGLSEHYRNLLVCKDMRTAALLEVGESIEQRFIDQSKQVDPHIILRSLAILSKSDVEYKASKNQRLLVELALMQLCSLKQEQEKKNG
jgi:DNA polymerase-3 subunit gamma/tau